MTGEDDERPPSVFNAKTGEHVATVTKPEDAALIVCAANAFEPMRKALEYLHSGWHEGVSCRGPKGVPECVPVLHPLVLNASRTLIERVDRTFGYDGSNRLAGMDTLDAAVFSHWDRPAFRLGELRALVLEHKALRTQRDALAEALEDILNQHEIRLLEDSLGTEGPRRARQGEATTGAGE